MMPKVANTPSVATPTPPIAKPAGCAHDPRWIGLDGGGVTLRRRRAGSRRGRSDPFHLRGRRRARRPRSSTPRRSTKRKTWSPGSTSTARALTLSEKGLPSRMTLTSVTSRPCASWAPRTTVGCACWAASRNEVQSLTIGPRADIAPVQTANLSRAAETCPAFISRCPSACARARSPPSGLAPARRGRARSSRGSRRGRR